MHLLLLLLLDIHRAENVLGSEGTRGRRGDVLEHLLGRCRRLGCVGRRCHATHSTGTHHRLSLLRSTHSRALDSRALLHHSLGRSRALLAAHGNVHSLLGTEVSLLALVLRILRTLWILRNLWILWTLGARLGPDTRRLPVVDQWRVDLGMDIGSQAEGSLLLLLRGFLGPRNRLAVKVPLLSAGLVLGFRQGREGNLRQCDIVH